MKRTSLQLHIAEPCHESWEHMLPEEKGRHCLACQKTVIDFTGMSTAEIVAFFSKKADSVCGRFRDEQLDTPLGTGGKNPFYWILFGLFVLAVACLVLRDYLRPQPPVKKSLTYARVKPKEKEIDDNGLIDSLLPPLEPSLIEEHFLLCEPEVTVGLVGEDVLPSVSGKVMGVDTVAGLAGVSIEVKGRKNRVISNETGDFTLYNVSPGDTLLISQAGYIPQEFVFQSLDFLSVRLEPMVENTPVFASDSVLMVLQGRLGGVQIEKPSLRKRLSYRIKSLFHK